MSISKFASKVNTSKIILKSSKSYTEYNNLYFPNISIYSDPNFKNVYPSVTRIVALLSEGLFSAWNQKIVLDSFVNQIVYLGKRQPKRIVSESDLQFLRKIAESAPKNELAKRGEYGTFIHSVINDIVAGKEIKETPAITTFLSGYRLWKKAFDIDIYYTDVFVKSETYKFSGFTDAIGMNSSGDIVLIDFKSGNNIYNSHAIQLAAYCKAFEEIAECTEPVKNAYVLQVRPDSADIGIYKLDNIDKAFEYFLHLRNLFDLQNEKSNLFQKIIYVCLLNYLLNSKRRDYFRNGFMYFSIFNTEQ